MKVTELRIGNFVNVNGWFSEIAKIGYNYVDISNGVDSHHIKELEPIPLTEQWLERLGFNDDGFKQYEFTNWGIKVKKDSYAISDPNWFVFHGFINQYSELVSLKYVHSLQNLYFCLTNEELEYDANR